MEENKKPKKLEQAVARRLSVEASCDPRTIQRVYQGESVRGMSGQRAQATLLKHGLIAASEETATPLPTAGMPWNSH
jgi:hypothetical protein